MNNAKFTNEVFQNEMNAEDLEFDVSKHQPYFEFEIKGEKCLIGLDKILQCVAIANKVGEIPHLGQGFWTSVVQKYNVQYYGYSIKLSEDD